MTSFVNWVASHSLNLLIFFDYNLVGLGGLELGLYPSPLSSFGSSSPLDGDFSF